MDLSIPYYEDKTRNFLQLNFKYIRYYNDNN